jgi:hypothetical protein
MRIFLVAIILSIALFSCDAMTIKREPLPQTITAAKVNTLEYNINAAFVLIGLVLVIIILISVRANREDKAM